MGRVVPPPPGSSQKTWNSYRKGQQLTITIQLIAVGCGYAFLITLGVLWACGFFDKVSQ